MPHLFFGPLEFFSLLKWVPKVSRLREHTEGQWVQLMVHAEDWKGQQILET